MNHLRTRRSFAHAHILSAFPHFPTNIRALEETTELILEEDEDHARFSLGLSLLRWETPSLIITNCSTSEKFIPRSLSPIDAHSYFDTVQGFIFSCSSYAPRSRSILLDRFPLLSEFSTSDQHVTDVSTL